MTDKLHLPIGSTSGICVCVPTILESPVTLLSTVFCLVQNVFVLGGALQYIRCCYQKFSCQESGFVHHTTSKEFQAFSHYAILPLVLRLFVPIGALLRNKELVEPGFGKT